MASDEEWNHFIVEVQKSYHLIWPSVSLFSEARKCYAADAYLAACVLCRASMEALLHIAKTREPSREAVLDPSTRLTQLIEWATKEKLLEGLEKEVIGIRDIGDLAQKLDKEYKEINEDLGIRVKEENWKELVHFYLENPARTWVKKKEALKTINETEKIIIQVTRERWIDLVK